MVGRSSARGRGGCPQGDRGTRQPPPGWAIRRVPAAAPSPGTSAIANAPGDSRKQLADSAIDSYLFQVFEYGSGFCARQGAVQGRSGQTTETRELDQGRWALPGLPQVEPVVPAVRFAEGRVRCSGYRVQEGGGRRMAEARRHEGPAAQGGARRRHSVYK